MFTRGAAESIFVRSHHSVFLYALCCQSLPAGTLLPDMVVTPRGDGIGPCLGKQWMRHRPVQAIEIEILTYTSVVTCPSDPGISLGQDDLLKADELHRRRPP